MARYQTSMRMGALNLLVLVIALCLTVLSVLALVTAHANVSLADKQAESVTENYAEEVVGQTFLAALDAKLAPSKAGGTVASGLNSSLRLLLPDMAAEACAAATDRYPEVDLTATADLLTIKNLYVEMKVSFDLRNNLDDDDLLEEVSQRVAERNAAAAASEEILDDGPGGSQAGSSATGPAAASGVEVIEEESVSGTGQQRIAQDVEMAFGGSSADAQLADTDFYYAVASVLEDCVGGIRLNVSSANGRNLDAIIGIRFDGNYVILSWKSSKEWYADQGKETLWMG